MRSSLIAICGVVALIIGSCTGQELRHDIPDVSPSAPSSTTEPQSPTTEPQSPTTPFQPPTTTVATVEVDAATDTQNLGLVAVWAMPLADGVAVGVVGSGEGGDRAGNRSDVVAHVIAAGSVVDTGLHAPWGVKPLTSGGFAVEISESDAGVDLTADNDLDDMVPHVWTADEGVLNLGVPGYVEPGPAGSLWVQVYEAGQHRDLNGDGDVGFEHVAHYWTRDQGWLNTGWATGSLTPLQDGTAIFGVFEEEQGVTDFNGDGATSGHFAVWWSPAGHEVIGPAYSIHALDDGGALISYDEMSAGGTSREWGLAIWHPDRDTVLLEIPTVNHRSIPGGGAFFRVAESPDYWSYQTACEVGRDLSGDGDCDDFVLHVWTPELGLVNLGLSDWWCPECDWGYVVVGATAFVNVPQDPGSGEAADGDKEHSVLHLVEGSRVTPLDVIPTTATTTWAVLDDGVVLAAGEAHRFTHVTTKGEITDLGLSGWAAYPTTEGAILLAGEGMSDLDLNGDGTIADGTLVAHVWRPGSDPVNLGLTVARFPDEFLGLRPVPPIALSGSDRLVVLVPEMEHGAQDLNDDGDLNDAVVHLARVPPG